MTESVVNMLRALRAYLWTCLVERPGPLWWGVAIVAGIVTYMLCVLYTRHTESGRGRALPAGILVGYAVAVTGWSLSRVVLACLGFSAWIETVQYICAVGYPDPFDIALNVLGAVVGYGVRALVLTLRARGDGSKKAESIHTQHEERIRLLEKHG